MTMVRQMSDAESARIRKTLERERGPGQIVLVLQGGGALGAYQAGVYQALHEAGIDRIGSSAPRLELSMPASSPVIRPSTACSALRSSGAGSHAGLWRS